MQISPTLDLHTHNEFHFAENTDSKGCCCFWSSKTHPKEFQVNDKMELAPCKKPTYEQRSKSNRRLAEIIMEKFDKLPIDNEKAFVLLKDKINEPMGAGDPITSEKLEKIIKAIHELRCEIRSSLSHDEEESDSTKTI